MRKGLAVRDALTRLVFTRLVNGLLSLLLALQIAGCLQSGHGAPARAGARTPVESLSAAIGRPVTLCEHGGHPSSPDDPATTGSCDHCIFCHSVAAGLAASMVAIDVARSAIPAEIERPREDVASAPARHLGSATQRGPPTFG